MDEILNIFRDGDKPKMHECHVVFADLLGTSARIVETDDTGDLEVLTEVTEALKEFHDFLTGPKSITRYYSDCVSLVTPSPITAHIDLESELSRTFLQVGRWQSLFMTKGFILRGGLAFGKLYMDEKSIFGRPHLCAYHLESKEAKSPRIILDQSVLDQVSQYIHYYGGESPYERDLILDEDGKVFVSYLRFANELARMEDFNSAHALLRSHSELIDQRLHDKNLTGHKTKYEWMLGYHNWFCKNAPRYENYDPENYLLPGGSSTFGSLRTFLKV